MIDLQLKVNEKQDIIIIIRLHPLRSMNVKVADRPEGQYFYLEILLLAWDEHVTSLSQC